MTHQSTPSEGTKIFKRTNHRHSTTTTTTTTMLASARPSATTRARGATRGTGRRTTREARRAIVPRASNAEENAKDAQRWIDAWTTRGSADGATDGASNARALREGELSIKKGLLGTFIKDGEEEVTAEKYREFQAEIARKKAEAKARQEEARKNKKGPFGLW